MIIRSQRFGCAYSDDFSYPPSPTHLCLFLSMLHANPTKESDTAAASLHPKTTRARPPRLLVLLEPSSYFLSSSASESCVSRVNLYPRPGMNYLTDLTRYRHI